MLTERIIGKEIRIGDELIPAYKHNLSIFVWRNPGTVTDVRGKEVFVNGMPFSINFVTLEWLRVITELPYDPTQQGDTEDDI